MQKNILPCTLSYIKDSIMQFSMLVSRVGSDMSIKMTKTELSGYRISSEIYTIKYGPKLCSTVLSGYQIQCNFYYKIRPERPVTGNPVAVQYYPVTR